MRGNAFLLSLAVWFCVAPARAEPPDYSRILSSVSLSFDNGDMDRAVLLENGDSGVDLYIYRALAPSSDKSATPALVKKNAAWSGAMWGQLPSLETNAKGALLIKSANDSIGRDRWSQTLTVIYRDKQFIVAGLTRETRDTLDLKNHHSCDLNFLSGKGVRDGKPVALKTPAPKLADWSDEKLPGACVF